MKNPQLPEKSVHDATGALQINSIFFTIQGEGPFAGRPSVFVRLAGCNLQCPGCDTEYTKRNLQNIEDTIWNIKLAIQNKTIIHRPLIVITGGEPFRQNLWPLIEKLLHINYEVQIETNGTLFQDLPYHNPALTIVCSPKTGSIHPKLFPHIKAFKYVITATQVDIDGLPLQVLEHPVPRNVAKPRQGALVYVQAADEVNFTLNNDNMKEAIRSSMFFGYTLCVQIHKLVGLD